jgi:tetratricopeptide (TPR) repeat protein
MLTGEQITRDFALAVQSYRAGRVDEAADQCRILLGRAPAHVPAQHLLGTIALQRGQPEAAVALLARAAARRPADPALHNLLGAAYLQLGRQAEAVRSLEAALALEPDLAEARCTLGVALAALGRADDAIASFRAALACDPDMAQAHFNLAGLFVSRGQVPAAMVHYRELVRLEPGNAMAHHLLGRGLCGEGDIDEGVRHFREAIRLQPGYAEARHNLGMTLAFAGRWEEALAALEETLRVEPRSPQSHYDLCLVLLMLGRFEAGWEELEWRWGIEGTRDLRRPFPQPQWRGEDLAGKSLMLHDEQGLGDTLQFCRYAPLVAGRGGKLYFEVNAALVTLLRRSFAGDRIDFLPRSPSFPGIDRLPACDYHSPLMSLPRVFGTRLESIPAEIPYLRCDPEKRRVWSDRLAFLPRPRVGLVWAGRPGYAQDAVRSIALARFAPLAGISGASFLSLQKGPAAAQLQTPPPGLTIHDFTADLADFDDTAALVDTLDLVISVDTAVAHLAGGLGKSVWLLNRRIPDWRWLLDREDSPWYPTLRLFRQPRHGDWDSVVARVAEGLAAFVGEGRPE